MAQKDLRYTTLKMLIEGGTVAAFRDMFKYIPKSVVYTSLGTNNVRFNKMLKQVDHFQLRELTLLASLIDVDPKLIIDLVYNQYLIDKEQKKK